jgi:hypothetical protein
MPLTDSEKETGGLVALKEYIGAGATPAQVKAFLASLDAPEVEEAEGVAAEKRGRLVRLPTGHEVLLLENGGFTFAGNYPPEVRRAVAAYLRDHPIDTSVVLAEGDCPPLPGDGQPSASDQLVTLMTEGRAPQGGLSAGAARMLAQSEGSAGLTIDEMPVPEDSLSLEEVRNAALVGRVVKSSKFTGETTADGFPVPA